VAGKNSTSKEDIMAKGFGKGTKSGSIAKPKGTKTGFVNSPAQLASKKGKC
jgi:hypothetical protein